MTKYFGWMFALMTALSLNAFAQDAADEAQETENTTEEVAVKLEPVDQ